MSLKLISILENIDEETSSWHNFTHIDLDLNVDQTLNLCFWSRVVTMNETWVYILQPKNTTPNNESSFLFNNLLGKFFEITMK